MKPTKRPIPALIIGAGLMGHWHAKAATRTGARLLGVVDPDIARARALAKRFPSARALDSVNDLAVGDTAVAHLCTPVETHADLVRTALARGWHALVEKPLAEDAATTTALLKEARDRSRLLCPVHQFVYQRGVQAILRRRDELGEIVQMQTVVSSAGGDSRPDRTDSLAYEILPHPLSLFERLSPGCLTQMRWQVASPRGGELAILGDDGHRIFSVIVSMHSRPTINELTVAGTHGTAHADLFHGYSFIESGKVSRRRKIVRPFGRAATTLATASTNLGRRAAAGQTAYPGLWELVEAFYDALARGEGAPVSEAETLAVAQALDSIKNVRLAR